MITFNSRILCYQIADRQGPAFDLFCFGGAVPATQADIPFNLFVDVVDPSRESGTETFKQLDGAAIYNNHICHNFVNADTSNAIGWDRVQISQNTTKEAGLTKASFFDASVNKYRHIPQTVETDLIQYDLTSNTNFTTGQIGFPYIFWPHGGTDWFQMQIPNENINDGFFISGDFGYEAAITEVKFTGVGNRNFSGDLHIFRWDDALLAGAGDWVLHHTHTMIVSSDDQNITLGGEMLTTKFKIEFDAGDLNSTSTGIRSIEFLGASPVVALPVVEPITWAMLVPRRGQTSSYKNTVPEIPFLMLTAGGPSDIAELKMNKTVAIAGRTNSLIACTIKFLNEEF